jgi:hypothetical protein
MIVRFARMTQEQTKRKAKRLTKTDKTKVGTLPANI